MNNSVTLQVEKISNGFLFTTIKDNVAGKKLFKENKTDFFKILKDDEAIGALIADNDDMLLLEVIRHDIVTAIPEKSNNEILGAVVEKFVYNPFPSKKEEDDLRLSINSTNAYTIEQLKEIDFVELNKQVPMSIKKRSELCGIKEATFISAWGKVAKGEAKFQHGVTRMYFTILAKYYEKVLGVQNSKKDQIEKLNEGIKKAIFGLDNIFQKNSHIHSNSVGPILADLKYLIGDKTNK